MSATMSHMIPRNVLSVFSDSDPFPTYMIRDLTYQETISLSVGAAGISGTQNAFKLNGLYDPNTTGVGHQPYGFDQIAALYGEYRVDFIAYEAHFTTPSGTANICCNVCIKRGAETLTGQTTDRLGEMPNVTQANLSTSGSKHAVVRGSVNLPELFGVSKERYLGDVNTSAAVTGDPAAAASFNVSISSYDGTASQTAACTVKLRYTARFFNRTSQSQS